MLPSNPRAGRSRSVTRQPTTSQSRSASRPSERYSVVSEDRGARGRVYDGGNTRQVRSQRSMGNVRPSRNKEAALPPPPPPTFPKPDMTSRSTRSYHSRPPPSRDSDSSSSSMSSSGSSFLDRMRHRGAPSSSSQSSFELDLDTSKETADQTFAANDLVSYGYSIWNRVATAASTWAGNGSNTGNNLISGGRSFSDQWIRRSRSLIWFDTQIAVAPSSGDSEITRALKAYHINKARDRSDLPDWLFDEHERGMGNRAQHLARYEERSEYDDTGPVMRARGRGFRDIYDSVAASSASETRGARGRVEESGSSAFASGGLDRSTTRATDRLKAIRDAKRQAARTERSSDTAIPRGGVNSVGSGRVDQYGRRYEDSLSSRRGGQEVFSEPTERIPADRVGLPTNPRRR
ncbi:hypothetical protein ACEPAG_5032 [Sanghuangporus baumii]